MLGNPFRCAGGKAESWVGLEDAADHEPDPEERTQSWTPAATGTVSEHACNADAEDDAENAGDDEVRDLKPAVLSHG